MGGLHVLLIDKKKHCVELELNGSQFKALNIKPENTQKHNKRIELNRAITEFLNKTEQEKQ